MTLEVIILLVFIGLLIFSMVRRILWLGVVAVVIGALIHFGALEFLLEFLRETMIRTPIIISIL